MKLLILYRPNSEHATATETYIRDFVRNHPDQNVEVMYVDTKEGSDKAELYDITQYPALLAVNDEGALLKFWQGEPLPLMDEVAAYQQ